MEYGFCEFFDKEMSIIDSFFKKGNNNNVLGLRKMNIRISNLLFPECSTLMPTIVYFYYLHAIYHVLKERDKKEPVEDEINKYEKDLSKIVIAYQKANRLRTKGFFNKAETRAYHWYKTSFSNLHYKDTKWKASDKSNKFQFEILKETPRYKFVKKYIDDYYDAMHGSIEMGWNGDKGIKKIIEKMAGDISCHFETIMDKLDNTEKTDFIRRVVQNYDSSRICAFSYLSNVILHLMGKGSVPINSILYNENYVVKKRSIDDLPLPSFIDMNYGGSIRGQMKMYDKLKLAQTYSLLQGIVKKVYNYLLFSNDNTEREKIISEIKELVNKYNIHIANDDYKWKKIKNNGWINCFCGIDKSDMNNKEWYADDLPGIYKFINSVSEKIPKNITDTQDIFVEKEWFINICSLVKEREKTIMGNDALLDSGFVTEKRFADYIDTFRWEYRPQEIVYQESQESEEENPEELEIDVDENSDLNKIPHNMCAQYFIYELFYE